MSVVKMDSFTAVMNEPYPFDALPGSTVACFILVKADGTASWHLTRLAAVASVSDVVVDPTTGTIVAIRDYAIPHVLTLDAAYQAWTAPSPK